MQNLDDGKILHELDRDFVYEDDTWKHKTRLKCIVNPILRKLQFWTDRPYVIASDCFYVHHFTLGKIPVFIGYKFCRVKYYKKAK